MAVAAATNHSRTGKVSSSPAAPPQQLVATTSGAEWHAAIVLHVEQNATCQIIEETFELRVGVFTYGRLLNGECTPPEAKSSTLCV